jgi:Peroxisomal biogenesis factor 11 (PEX11)
LDDTLLTFSSSSTTSTNTLVDVVDVDDDKAKIVSSSPSCTTKLSLSPGRSMSICKLIHWMDRFLAHYVTFVSSAANQDKGFKFVQWTLWLFSRIYPKYKQSLLKRSWDISLARYLLRWYGMPVALDAIRNGSWDDANSPRLGRLMAWSMFLYYPLEHVAYIHWTSPNANMKIANRYSALSCRCWLLYLMAELIQGIWNWIRLYRESSSMLTNQVGNKKSSYRTPSLVSQEIQLMRSALFTLPCLHWSLDKWDTEPWLSDSICSGLSWLESVVCMYQAIRKQVLDSQTS